jgi:hypothetical protein
MYVKTQSYPFMDGEPHLGTVTESEIVESYEGEVRELILAAIQEDYAGSLPTEVDVESEDEETIPLNVADWFDPLERRALDLFLSDPELGREEPAKLLRTIEIICSKHSRYQPRHCIPIPGKTRQS